MGAVDPERKADSTATLPPGYARLSHAAPRVRIPVFLWLLQLRVILFLVSIFS